ncbi:flavodoxin-dependent (E)-4-hydroxy-3-methylbut-2-enyl-diphosphate synthase [Chloroflexota bacterium]
MKQRRQSKRIMLGNVAVGGDAPITVQSMTKTDTRDVRATVEQIAGLVDAGCDIVRLAVPDLEAASALAEIRACATVPLVADIHFDHRLALAAMDAGVDGLRLNPGNIRRHEDLERVVLRAKERQVPIRIGVNGGSLPSDYQPEGTLPERMVAIAEEQIAVLESLDFDLVKVSLKASDVQATVDAYVLMADRSPYPLHLGVTEAGPPMCGAIRNAMGMGILLHLGIGDTIRVSMSGDPLLEVDAGRETLASLGLRDAGPRIVSCPTCGRTTLDVPGIAARVAEYTRAIREPLHIAVMGCVVNGPGECGQSDVGIAGGVGKVAVYRGGAFAYSVPVDEAFETLKTEIDALVESRQRE